MINKFISYSKNRFICEMMLFTGKFGNPKRINLCVDKIDLVFNCETQMNLFDEKYNRLVYNASN
jgi:hypothetical protein